MLRKTAKQLAQAVPVLVLPKLLKKQVIPMARFWRAEYSSSIVLPAVALHFSLPVATNTLAATINLLNFHMPAGFPSPAEDHLVLRWKPCSTWGILRLKWSGLAISRCSRLGARPVLQASSRGFVIWARGGCVF